MDSSDAEVRCASMARTNVIGAVIKDTLISHPIRSKIVFSMATTSLAKNLSAARIIKLSILGGRFSQYLMAMYKVVREAS